MSQRASVVVVCLALAQADAAETPAQAQARAQAKAAAQAQMLSSVAVGDEILTVGGIYDETGPVDATVERDTVRLIVDGGDIGRAGLDDDGRRVHSGTQRGRAIFFLGGFFLTTPSPRAT
jgi:hypothetical protein